MALSREAARGVWDEAARGAYRSATQGIKSAYANCVKGSGDTITISRTCLKNAAKPLKDSLSAAWGA